MKRALTLLSIIVLCAISFAPNANAAKKSEVPFEITSSKEVFKSVEDLDLNLHIIAPEGYTEGKSKNAFVFYFGGGWNSGTPTQFKERAEYFATHGFVCFLVEYRTKKNGTTPDVSLMDAKSAIRYIKANAKKFNINPKKIVTSGGSAGGHLAAAVAMCPEINDPTDDLSIPTDVCANVLYNPVVCNGPGKSGADKGYGYDRVAEYYKEFSPYYNVRKGVAPSIFLVGDKDHLIDVEVAYAYQKMFEECGSRCDVIIYEGASHGFFNIISKTNDMTMFVKATIDSHNFLKSLGLLKSDENVAEWAAKCYPQYKVEL
ncbi:MAG: alpha/beta hydrolase [Rikenellaceae bacterium]